MEPTVSEEKLRLLLAEGHESEQLDYKAACDLALARDTVELAKDVGAMQVLGGYLVIGADDHGKTTGILTAEQANQFDESRLRAKVRKYLAEPLDLLSAVHTIEGVLVAVIYVGPNSNGMAIFASDGAYGDQKMAFREGDVFVRHGTASERWQQADLDRIYERAISVRKEGWRREIAESLREALEAGRGTQDLAAGPVEAVDWRLDADTFVGIIMEQLRRGDDIPLHLALEHMTTDAIAFESVDGHEELSTLLDRLACLGALFVRIERPDWLNRLLHNLLTIYEAPMLTGSTVRAGPAATLSLAISERLEALGGLAVRRESWAAVRVIALLRTPGPDKQHWPYLLRHTVVSAGRDGLLQPQGAQAVQLLSLGGAIARRLECLRPDLPPDDERILNSICQFDALAAIAAMGDSGSDDSNVFFTSFAYYYPHRTGSAEAD